ncbi:imidazole glycerol phosphate synthase subunit HisH [Chryseobacterium tructae]|uniref:Imidazole glycerol phosphate synthase subunit HisH n=1 Tax=Chryseobacterium tructae TaxID=1037380 RepID=A0ABV7XUR9_9FLAO|nr:imidazole glycerol phosphate synthase subunit HisH [Chryseobacterium tructae]MDN3691671.1 imidazole glycerol phosphate synthase subunit HisH [Chryseobacterium tructae]
MITVINYGVGNINAFINIYKKHGIPTNIATHFRDLDHVNNLILPGVGSFDYAMQMLNASGMRERLDELVLNEKKNVLGICVGMQMMAKSSEEGKSEGLDWIRGKVKKIDTSKINHRSKLPHMGWNTVKSIKDHVIFKDMQEEELFYFLHSYYFEVENDKNCYGLTHYGEDFASIIHEENIYGIQCHPEKSHIAGENFLKNFAKL